MKTIVFSEDAGLCAELIGAGKVYGSVAAIVVGSAEEAKAAAAFGADVFWLNREDPLLDNYISTISSLLKEERPRLFLVGATTTGKMVAGRVAASLRTVAVSNAKALKQVGDAIEATQMIYSGGAVRTQKANTGTLVALVRPGFAEPAEKVEPGTVTEVAVQNPPVRIALKEVKEKPATNDGILTAKTVVGVGGAFDTNEQINLARDLADALGGEMGYTRPLIEGNPPVVPNEPYIGVSGIQIKPDLYIAVGISGQTQHVVGVNESKVIVCVNKDGNAPMFRHSDYGIVGDLYEILPVVTKAIRDCN